MQISDAQQKAAGELVDLIASRLGAGRAVHPVTAIASAARLAGSLLLRSFDLGLETLRPGDVVLSDQANEEGPQLIGIFQTGLQVFGVAVNMESLAADAEERGTQPQLSVVNSLALLQADALRIARENRLSLKEAACAGAIATAFIVKECVGSIGAEAGCDVALYGFLEGCKTAPPHLAAEPSAPVPAKPG